MSQSEKRQHAAALKYSAESSRAPVVVAAGLGYAAQKIIDIAQDSNVPVYQDDTLACLLSQLDAGSEIPPELYQAIVDIYIYFLNYGSGTQDQNSKISVPGSILDGNADISTNKQ